MKPPKSNVWTVESLYTHFSRIIKDLEKQVDAQFKATKRLRDAEREALNIAIRGVENTADTARSYSDKAINKAEDAQEKRWIASNEIRGAMRDRDAEFATKTEMEAKWLVNADKIADLAAWRGRVEGKELGMGQAASTHQISANFIVALIMALVAIAAVMVAVFKH